MDKSCSPNLVDFGLLFRGAKHSTANIADFLSQRDKIWLHYRGIGAQQVLRDFGELWFTFPGSTHFRQRIFRTFWRVTYRRVW